MSKYDEWIAEYQGRNPSLLGRCGMAVAEMTAEFPELRIVRGHTETVWGRRGHFWCVSPDDEIVDPTAAQYPGPILYEAWKPGDEVRVGTCMNCGIGIWLAVNNLDDDHEKSNPGYCSDECHEDLRRDFG